MPNRNEVDWKKIRIKFREKAGRLIGDFWTALFPSLNKLWINLVTYQEGLLCSACEPNFNRFFDPVKNQLKLRGPAAEAVGDAAVDVIKMFDAFMSNSDNAARIKDLVQDICQQGGSTAQCVLVPSLVASALSHITTSPLRHMICNAKKGELPERNEFCKNFVLNDVLRGLVVDTKPLISNVFDYLTFVCPKGVAAINCDQFETTKQGLLDLYYTFDERPVPRNIYAFDGYDVMLAACDSNLSGYACGKPGPKPESHKADSQAGNSGPIIITIVVLLTVGSIGAVLFISRHRVARVASTWYTRLRDGDDGSGPTVGLV